MRFRSFDGSANNLIDPTMNEAGDILVRLAPDDYLDGIAQPAEGPNPREISNLVVGEGDAAAGNTLGLSAFMYAWGQFIDHDLDRIPADYSQLYGITVPAGDAWLQPGSMIAMFRSIIAPGTGTDPSNPARPLNAITGWLDASMVYGSDAVTAAMLRGADGHMLTSAGDNLPIVGGLFMAGDVRAMENPSLTSLQTLFVREHNWWVDRLHAQDPSLSAEDLYQTARAIVGAEIAHITYDEFLPHLLGPNAIPAYAGYDPGIDARISVEFAGAAYRFGHSTVSANTERLDEQGHVIGPELTLRDTFFLDPAHFAEADGADGFIRHLGADVSQEMDARIVNDLRNFLFDPPAGIDLAAINIQRGRDLGLGTLNETRIALGLAAYTDFAQITDDAGTLAGLQAAFGNVDAVDLWTGGLAERHAPGAFIGETFARIITDQFIALRDGDAFWYQNVGMDAWLLDEIQHTTLTDIILRDTNTKYFQPDAFLAYERRAPDAPMAEPELRQLIIGGAGDESFRGSAQDDIMIGGGGRDTAFFAATYAQSIILHQADGSWLVRSPEGSDTLRDIMFAQFADGRVHLGPAAALDFAGSGHASVLWQGPGRGLYAWSVEGDSVVGHHGFEDLPPGTKLVGSGDIDGDGRADIVLQRGNALTIWFTERFDVSHTARATLAHPGESVQGVGDLDGDGRADIVLRGADKIVRMLHSTADGFVEQDIGALPGSWQVKAVADFDGDHKADLLLGNGSGWYSLWRQDGATTLADDPIGQVNKGWNLAGVGDFDGDGRADTFWRGPDGDTALFLMDGATITERGGFGQVDASWQVAEIADFSGDGRDDILWLGPQGQLWLWQTEGMHIAQQSLLGVTPAGWHLA